MKRALEDWLKGYLFYTSFNEAPDIFHFWAGVGTIAGALRRKVFIDQQYFQWTPNFYIIFVAPPGVATKSTTMGNGVGILREIEGIKFGPAAITWQALTQYLAESAEMIMMPDGNYHPMSCLTFASSELGSLLDPRDRKMMDVLVDLWDGQVSVWEKHTKTSGHDTIQNPWLNILACTTPSWLADNMPRQMIGGGFTSRCVFVYGEDKRQLVAYPKQMIPEAALQTRDALRHDLEIISTLKGEFQMSPEAIEFGTRWYAEQYKNPPAGLAGNSQFKGYLARKQGHVHKLAMVLAVSRTNELVLHKQDLEKAIRMMGAMEQDLPKVFRAINTSLEMEKAEMLIDRVYAAKGISKQQLYQSFFHMLSLKEFNEAIEAALQAGLLVQVPHNSELWLTPGGRRTASPGTNGCNPSGAAAPSQPASDSSSETSGTEPKH